MHTAASVLLDHLLDSLVDPVVDRHPSLGYRLGIADEAFDCLAHRSQSCFVHQADLLCLDGTCKYDRQLLRICE